MMLNPVVITRPTAQAVTLVAQVEALKREVVLFPLLEIQPLLDSSLLQATLEDLNTYSMVVFISPNAIDASFSELHRRHDKYTWPNTVAIGVMGEGSRAALVKHGISDANATIISPNDVERTDSETFLASLDATAWHDKKILIVRGENGREFLAQALQTMGAQVQQVAAYRRLIPAFDRAFCSQLQNLLVTPHDWIVTSSEALRVLMQRLVEIGNIRDVAKMQRQKIIVPHRRIAETAQQLGFLNITLTGSGDERLLAALQSCP